MIPGFSGQIYDVFDDYDVGLRWIIRVLVNFPLNTYFNNIYKGFLSKALKDNKTNIK